MTLEEQIWEDLVSRKQFCSAKQISRKLMISISYVRTVLIVYHKRAILDKVVRDKKNFYRIKP